MTDGSAALTREQLLAAILEFIRDLVAGVR
jgi:hypothetical protein